MRPQVVTQVGNGSTAWIPVDWRSTPFNLSFGCVVVSGSPTYKVEHTFDDLLGGASATAFTHEFITASTTSDDGNYAFPITGIRLTISSGNGTVTLTALQPGSPK